MRICELIEIYVGHKKSLGYEFRPQAYLLRAFSKQVGDVEIESIEAEDVLGFLNGSGSATMYWYEKFHVLSGLYRFAIARGYASRSPLPSHRPHVSRFVPYIYSDAEIKLLLSNTTRACTDYCSMSPKTFRILLLLLWGTGLRVGEVLRLKLSDIDERESVLTIKDTKFFKSRLVPVDFRLAGYLNNHIRYRRRLPLPAGHDSVVFSKRNGQPISRAVVEMAFQRLRMSVGIRRDDGSSYQPRIHDLRHTFAVNRITAWYKNSDDVQRLLPLLSTYLGHTDLNGTQKYLTLTPELLQQASQWFEHYARGNE